MDIPTLVKGCLFLPIILAPFAAFAFFAMWLDKKIEQGNVQAAVVKAVLVTFAALLILSSIVWRLAEGKKLGWEQWILACLPIPILYFQWKQVKGMKAKKKQTSDD